MRETSAIGESGIRCVGCAAGKVEYGSSRATRPQGIETWDRGIWIDLDDDIFDIKCWRWLLIFTVTVGIDVHERGRIVLR